MREARVLLVGPMMAHCISKGLVLQFDSEYSAYLPICDNWNQVLYEWIWGYLEKMKQDLVRIGAWDSA